MYVERETTFITNSSYCLLVLTKNSPLVSYDKDDLQYTWKKNVGTEIYIYDKEMAQFTVFNATRKLKHPLYHSGENVINITLTPILLTSLTFVFKKMTSMKVVIRLKDV